MVAISKTARVCSFLLEMRAMLQQGKIAEARCMADFVNPQGPDYLVYMLENQELKRKFLEHKLELMKAEAAVAAA